MNENTATPPQVRWILAFDASCATCRQIAATVRQAGDGKLEVLPLSNPEVRQWRTTRPGEEAPPAPTLIKVTDGEARQWTGAAMALPLVRHLGVRSTTAVLRGLGRLRQESRRPLPAPGHGDAMGRSQFLRLGTGAAVAAGIVLLGRTPAFAEDSCRTALAWAQRNKNSLPQRYSDLVTYPLVYRRAIYSELSAKARSRMWLEHLEHYRATRPDMTPQQRAVYDQAVAWASSPNHFADDNRTAATPALKRLSRSASEAFGPDGRSALLGTLGPAEAAEATARPAGGACTCTDEDDQCTNATHCQYGEGGCQMYRGCGAFWQYVCNGLCIN
ncbi:bacteriocin fulvocin C-related protein [Streptomyces misionensis]|uniref:bacteriocin fulvocin C-related protein n=1 Tax=Streptomyces misionensis TaxID=67331 RepID=UPI00340A1130